MKKAIVVLAIVFLSGMAAQAQTGGGMTEEQKGQAGPGMMPCDQEHMPMMKQMRGHGMMMQDMMQMMKRMIEIQQKMIEGVKPAEKKEMMTEMTQMMDRMDKMMSEMKDMMSQGMMMQGMMAGAASAETMKAEQTGGQQKTQEKSEAGVTVKVSREGSNGTISFKVALETHTVDLEKYKFDDIVMLRAGGKVYKARVKSQEGSVHHRSAVVEFDNPGTKEVEVIIKDVAGVKERVFAFSVAESHDLQSPGPRRGFAPQAAPCTRATALAFPRIIARAGGKLRVQAGGRVVQGSLRLLPEGAPLSPTLNSPYLSVDGEMT